MFDGSWSIADMGDFGGADFGGAVDTAQSLFSDGQGGGLESDVQGLFSAGQGGGLESDVQGLFSAGQGGLNPNGWSDNMPPNTVNGQPIERLPGGFDPQWYGGGYREAPTAGSGGGQQQQRGGQQQQQQQQHGGQQQQQRGGGGGYSNSGISVRGPAIQMPDASSYLPTASGIAGIQSGISGALAGLDPEMVATLKALGISESGTADQLIGAGMGGALPAGYQGVVNQQLGREQADTNRTFGAMGLGSSTMAAQAREGAYGHAAATEVGIRDQLLKSGMAEQQASAQATQSAGALNAQQVQLNLQAQQQQQALMHELDSLATSLYGMEASLPGVQVLTPGANTSTASTSSSWAEQLSNQLGRPLSPEELFAAKAQGPTKDGKPYELRRRGVDLGSQGANFWN